MKKNYIHNFIIIGLLFFGFVGYAQHNLTSSEYNNVIQTYLSQNQAKKKLEQLLEKAKESGLQVNVSENILDPINLMRLDDENSFRPEDDDYDLSYRNAAILIDAGLTVAIGMEGQMERMNTRNLPFYAGTTVAHGLSKEQALQLICLNTAKILGIDAKYGSLEVGKSATLFISKGDALDMRSNHLTAAFIDGRKISLESHHTELYERYKGKFEQQKK